MWVLSAANGYPYNIDIYCGKSLDEQSLLGSRVVSNLLNVVHNPSAHVVFFDNIFTSYQLMADLTDKGFRACGTIRDNRTGKCPLPANSVMKKQERGSYDFRSDGKVICMRWNENSVVTVASNHFVVKPLQTAHRRMKGQKSKSVKQPNAIRMYKQGMGGVDVLDRILSTYRPRLRAKKWWWNLFANGLNMAVVAAYRFYQYLHPEEQITYLNFRRSTAISLVKAQPPRLRLGGPTAPTVESVRFDGINHILDSCEQGRCVVCSKNTRLRCVKCAKRLHKLCSAVYHAK